MSFLVIFFKDRFACVENKEDAVEDARTDMDEEEEEGPTREEEH